MPNDYVLTQDVKDMMPDVALGATYDALIALLITRAGRDIDRYCNMQPGAFKVDTAPVEYFFDGGRALKARLWLPIMAAVPTAVRVAESGILTTYTAWAATDYIVGPYNAAAEGIPFRWLEIDILGGTKSTWYNYLKNVGVTARWGYSVTPPAPIVQANLIQVIRWFKRGQQAFQDVGGNQALGQLDFSMLELDPDMRHILRQYRELPI